MSQFVQLNKPKSFLRQWDVHIFIWIVNYQNGLRSTSCSIYPSRQKQNGDLNNIAAAIEFVELSLHFATYHESANRGLESCQRAIELCNAIKLELGL